MPPVSLYRLDGAYFVQDGHHGVSVACFHGVEWMDAGVTESRSPKARVSARLAQTAWSPRHRQFGEALGALVGRP